MVGVGESGGLEALEKLRGFAAAEGFGGIIAAAAAGEAERGEE